MGISVHQAAYNAKRKEKKKKFSAMPGHHQWKKNHLTTTYRSGVDPELRDETQVACRPHANHLLRHQARSFHHPPPRSRLLNSLSNILTTIWGAFLLLHLPLQPKKVQPIIQRSCRMYWTIIALNPPVRGLTGTCTNTYRDSSGYPKSLVSGSQIFEKFDRFTWVWMESELVSPGTWNQGAMAEDRLASSHVRRRRG